MIFDIFKKKTISHSYDIGPALSKLSAICQKNNSYSLIFPSVYYDLRRNEYTVFFQCAQKEYTKKDNYFWAIRRNEKLRGANLERLLEFAMTYASYPDAFIRSPQDSLPEGITIQIKIFNRRPHNLFLSHKL